MADGLNISKTQLLALLERAEQPHVPPEVRERLQWFLHFAEHRSISKTCREFGIARTTLYRWFKRFDPEHLTSLCDQPTTPPAHLRSSYEPQVVPAYAGVRRSASETQPQPLWPRVKPLLVASLLSNAVFGLLLVAFLNLQTPSSQPREMSSPLPAAILHHSTNATEPIPTPLSCSRVESATTGTAALICVIPLSHE